MKTILHWIVAAALLGLVGCDNGETTEAVVEPTEAPADPQAEATEAVEEDVEPTSEELPIAEDFADEAEQAVNEDNYGDELTRLTQEIEADLEAGGAAD